MKKISKLFTVVLSAVFLFSCNNSFNPQNIDNPANNSDLAQIVVNIEDSASRTAFAHVSLADMNSIKLEYKTAGATEEYSTLATWENGEEISSNPAYLDPDTYDFQISANASGFIYKAEKPAVTLVKGLNTIDAQLVLVTMGTPVGTGTFELTLTVPDQALSNYAEISVMKNGTVLADYAAVPCTLNDEADNKVKVVAKSIEGKALESGMYEFVINVYTDSYTKIKVVSYKDSIQIVNNIKTEKAFTRQALNPGLKIGKIKDDKPNEYVICDKKMFIGGSGELELTEEQKNYATMFYEAPLNEKIEEVYEIEEVYIDDGIRAIHEYVFYNLNIRTVKGGNGLEVIGDNAFEECQFLKEIPAFENVGDLGKKSFAGCSALKKINGFNNITELSFNTFDGCSSLEKINGFNKVTEIGSNAFSGCSKLEEIEIFDNVTKIGYGAFSGCSSLKYLGKIKHSEEDVEVSVFDKVTTIGQNAFSGCNAIEEINGFNALEGTSFPAGIKTGDGSKIKSIKGFNKLTEIPYEAFKKNTSLETIEGFASITSIGNNAFYNCSSLKSYNFTGNSLESIGDYAFSGCESLTEIVIPASVKSIWTETFLGHNATSIYILNPEISFSGYYNHFLPSSGYFTGDFYFAGTKEQWDIVLGYNNDSKKYRDGEDYSNIFRYYGFDSNNTPHFNYSPTSTN